MREMNRLESTNKPIFDEHLMLNQWQSQDQHDSYIRYPIGILYRRRSASVRQLFSTA